MANRKTTTSNEVKDRWKAAHYTRITLYLPKCQAEEYKSKCDRLGISLSEIPKEAISKFLCEEAK